VQKMAQYASFCLIMGPFKGEVAVFARLWPIQPSWHEPKAISLSKAQQY